MGGEEKQVYLHKLKEMEDGTLKLGSDKELAMCFDTPVMKLEYYCAGGKLLGVSED